MPGERARSALGAGGGSRFADVRWVDETGSTNADAMALALAGAPEGVVVVADHQTAGRGRAGRTWSAPPGASLLVSVLLRPSEEVADACTMAMGLAAAAAIEELAGFAPRLKWPNDLVWPGDGTATDRKLAGILAEAHWPGPAIVVGIGINVAWPAELPEDLREVAVACNHVTGGSVDREDLLVALLRQLDERYSGLLEGHRAELQAEWRQRTATLGRPVRVSLHDGQVVGTAVDITADGHLVVEDSSGERHVLAVGDVVHLRPERA